MTKTKVFLSPSVLEYRQEMAQAVEQVRRVWNIAGVKPCSYQPPFQIPSDAVSSEPRLAGLLKPPRIEIVIIGDFLIEKGWIDETIQFWTWGDFGPLHVMVNILDEQGQIIESNCAIPNELLLNHWGYFVELEAGDCNGSRSLTIQAIVSDRLGGTGMQTVTVPVVKRRPAFPFLNPAR